MVSKNVKKNKKTFLVALLILSYRCIVTINVLWLFLTVPWVGLQCVIVVFPDHTHLLFALRNINIKILMLFIFRRTQLSRTLI